MSKKKHKPTDAELYSGEFEHLSEEIVNFLFRGTGANIVETKPKKDGGYDIVVECSNGCIHQKVYFECKLRSQNMNLRDIAANIIIAYNEGALAFVAITNYDYTDQVSENIKTFYQKTILNIKVIVGEEIRTLAQKCEITIPKNLEKLIIAKKTYRKQTYDFLKINLDSDHPYEKILKKGSSSCAISKTFVIKHYEKEILKIQDYLKKGNLVCVEGFTGIGKNAIINFCLQELTAHPIRIIADNYLSQAELLLSVFLDLWGIPMHAVVKDFSSENIEDIVATVKKISHNEGTGEIIKKLIDQNTSDGIANEHYNYLICQYLINVLKMHHEMVSYIFYIENAAQASNEIQQFLIYLCKLLKQNKIACIVKRDIVEYQWQYNETSFFDKIDSIKVPIELWKDDVARNFVDSELGGCSKRLRQAVLNRGGVRLLTLSLIIEFCKEKYRNGIQVTETDLQQFEPNEIPQSIDCLLKMYFERTNELFCYFYFANGKLPIEWTNNLLKPYQESLDHLLNMGFLGIDDTYIWVKSQLAKERIQQLVFTRQLSLRNSAQQMLKFLQAQGKNEHTEILIYIYDSLNMHDAVIPLLDQYMQKLYKERQYHSFLKLASFVYERKKELGLPLQKQLELIVHILIVLLIKREINCDSAVCQMKQLHDCISVYAEDDKTIYQMAFDCFYAESCFQNCDFQKALECSEVYYQKSLSANLIHTDYEWQEKICIIYALSIKEQQGNLKALKIFEHLIKIFSKSFFVQMEYWDHLECINFYNNPMYSLECVNKVIHLFENTPRYDSPLPFHEYVDRAMCALCAKNFDLAMRYSNESIDILESNGILSSLGRAYNIKGCIFLCKKDITHAKECFIESKYLLDESREYLYSWRSSLNLITLDLVYRTADTHIQEIMDMLNETYNNFRNIYDEKMKNLVEDDFFATSREYYALLMFQYAFKLCNNKNDIMKDFNLADKTEIFLKQFQQLCDSRVKSADFSDCAYSTGKYLFIVG